jgi:hypothetical protein
MFINVSLQKLLVYFEQIFLLIPVIAGFKRKIYSSEKFKLIFYLLICYLFFEAALSYLSYLKQNNLYIVYIGTFVEFSVLSVFYYKSYLLKRSKVFVLICYPVFLLFLYTDYHLQTLQLWNTYSLSVESLCIIIFTLLSFYEITQDTSQKLFNIPMFWINSAFLIYYSGNLLVFVFNNYLYMMDHTIQKKIWMINSILNIIYYIPISIGFWKVRK